MCPLFCGWLLGLALILLAVVMLPLLPVSNLVTDTVAHFMPWYPLAGVALMIMALITLAPGAVIVITALSLLLAAWQLRPWGEQRFTPDPEAEQLIILQANILRGQDDLTRLRKLIARHQPDIIALQEAGQAAGHLLEQLQEGWPHQLRALHDHDSFGLAVASRLPLQASETLTYSRPHIPAFRFDVTFGGAAAEVIVLHPANPLRDFNGRTRDLALLADDLRERGERPRILTGDFNVTPFAADYRLLTRRLALRGARENYGLWRHYYMGSWPVSLPAFFRLPIDHTLHTQELVTAEYSLLDDIGSDHLPSLTRLYWR